MEINVQTESRKDLANHVASLFRFSQTTVRKLTPVFHIGDFPFAVTVFCSKQERGYIADYWISGRRYSDDEPRLVMRLTAAINAGDRDELQTSVSAFWETQLQEMAFGSAMVGGIATHKNDEITKQARDDMLIFHLHAHDRFAEAMGDQKLSKVEQTARWHNLIRSFDVLQTQKIICAHQWVSDLAEEGTPSQVFEERDRKRSAVINSRLVAARKQGLLTEYSPSERRSSSTTRRKKKDEQSI
jgi:hypothetical protein